MEVRTYKYFSLALKEMKIINAEAISISAEGTLEFYRFISEPGLTNAPKRIIAAEPPNAWALLRRES